MQVRIEENVVEAEEGQTCWQILSQTLSGKKLKQTVACKCDSDLIDLSGHIPYDCQNIDPILLDSPEGFHILQHSTAHIMAQAVKRLFPKAKVTIGPAIEKGFYYDFDFERSFTPDDLEAIEKSMADSIAADLPFERKIISKKEARKLFLEENENYKLELLDEIDDDYVSIYSQGEFTDLCRGPHLPSTGFVKAYKLTSVAGAYWRGDENRPMLQRIYGTAWPTEKDLKSYLNSLEEARKRDHRKLGAQLDLYSFSDEAGPGMPIFHPKGALIRTILEDFEVREHLKRGYQLVQGPQLLRKELWEKSGHYANYSENMYFSKIDDQVYGLKPMNCLAHMLIYKSQIRSYRELPIRYFELGTVHRHEKSGVLHGLMRVRQFTQDDAHIICRPDQLQEEIRAITCFVQDVMRLFDFEYCIEISTKPEKYIGSDDDWSRALEALYKALDSQGLYYDICVGEGAFYGPKIDIKIKDAIGRYWQCATIQCDFTLPVRFDLSYIGQDGEKHRPAMLHRVILGAVERFMGVLIEHYAGALPTWLAPVQARVLTINEDHIGYAKECTDFLQSQGLRVENDFRNEKLGFKIREAQVSKIPYTLIVGDKEVQESNLNVRIRGNNQSYPMGCQEIIDMVGQDCLEPFKRGGMNYSFNY